MTRQRIFSVNALVRIILLCLFSQATPASGAEEQGQNEIFAKFVGNTVAMDSQAVSRVLAGTHGVKLFVDTDGDGRDDTAYFVDIEERHGDRRQPLVVKVVDEDGDMHESRACDLDSDLYIADWQGDGSIDRIIDYVDLDGDGDVDEQYLYQWSESEGLKRRMPKFYPGKAYLVAWAKDYGDDNRLWYHTNYEYGQRITQWKTDFNGDEMFVYLFFYDYEENTLTPIWENAFSFYDLDGDTFSEEVVRFTGTGSKTDDLRYSMDIDNDTEGENRHDYDFSLSGIGPVDFRSDDCRTVTIRGHVTEPIMQWERMRDVAKQGPWNKIHLTWDENDNNVDPLPGRMHNERWEGVLNHGNDYMPQVGGPTCGPHNKRNEIDQDGSGKMQMYHSPIDRRLHLFGAEVGWIEADYNYDGTVDMVIWMDDTDGDGYFDLWKYDCDGDGTYDRTVNIKEDRQPLLPFEYSRLQNEYRPLLSSALTVNVRCIDALKKALKELESEFKPDEIETYYNTGLAEYDVDYMLGEKIRNSREGRRYYQDLIRERYWHRLTQTNFVGNKEFKDIQNAYDRGEFQTAARHLETKF